MDERRQGGVGLETGEVDTGPSPDVTPSFTTGVSSTVPVKSDLPFDV